MIEIYHEHVIYFTPTEFKAFLKQYNEETYRLPDVTSRINDDTLPFTNFVSSTNHKQTINNEYPDMDSAQHRHVVLQERFNPKARVFHARKVVQGTLYLSPLEHPSTTYIKEDYIHARVTHKGYVIRGIPATTLYQAHIGSTDEGRRPLYPTYAETEAYFRHRLQDYLPDNFDWQHHMYVATIVIKKGY